MFTITVESFSYCSRDANSGSQMKENWNRFTQISQIMTERIRNDRSFRRKGRQCSIRKLIREGKFSDREAYFVEVIEEHFPPTQSKRQKCIQMIRRITQTTSKERRRFYFVQIPCENAMM